MELTNQESKKDPNPSIKTKETSAKSKEKWRITKSLLTLAAVIYGIFTAYTALEILQSTINKDIGINSIVMLYTTKMVTSFLGPLIVSKVTPKWTIFLSCLCCSSYVLANFYPKWYVLLPAGALVGLATGPFWISVNLYVTVLGCQYADITGATKATVLSRWNSLVMLTMPISMISGNFLSSTILRNVHFSNSVEKPNDLENTTDILDTYSYTSTSVKYEITSVPFEETSSENGSISLEDFCGPNFCPWMVTEASGTNIKNFERPEEGAMYLLTGVLGLFNLFAVLLTLFGLKNLKEDHLFEMAVKHNSLCRYILHYLKLFFNWHFLLLIPSLVYMHFTLSLISALFSRAYLSCVLGVGMIGYVSMTRGIAGFCFNIINGFFGGKVNIRILLLIAFIVSSSFALLLRLWQFVPNETVAAVLAAALAGTSVSLNLTQMPAFLGAEFNNKVAVFSFYHFISGITLALGYLCNNYICAKHQIYIYMTLMGLSLPTFILLNVVLHKNAKKKKADAINGEGTEFVQKLSQERAKEKDIADAQERFLTTSQVSLTFS